MLLFKIILAPLLIGLVTLAGRRWGPGISGWLLGIPVNSGPILLFLALEQGEDFASHAALGALLGILSWGTFNLVYAWCCLRLRWWWSTAVAWTACWAVMFAMTYVRIGVLWAFVMVCALTAVSTCFFPDPPVHTEAVVHSPYDLWLRMATAALFIFTLTAIARLVGPRASGVLSAFPAFTTILAVFNHRLHPAAAIRVLKGVSTGLYTAASFFLVVAVALKPLGIIFAFSLATVIALLLQGASLLLVRSHALTFSAKRS